MPRSHLRRALLGDRAPDARPHQKPGPVAVPEHQIGISGRLELGMVAELMHHRVSGPQDFEIGQHIFSTVHSIGCRVLEAAFSGLRPNPKSENARRPVHSVFTIPTPIPSEACRATGLPPPIEVTHKTI